MKLKLDENIARSVRTRLMAIGFDVDTVLEEGLGGYPDNLVWESAQTEERLSITQDLDFSDIRKFAPGTHHGLLVVLCQIAINGESATTLSAGFPSQTLILGHIALSSQRPTRFASCAR